MDLGGATTPEWINAGVGIALVVVAAVGFVLTIITLTQARNRQRLEIEGYIRVDIGPPDGTDDYEPPNEISYVESGHLLRLGRTTATSPVISVWYRNLQLHPLGVALGVASRVAIAAIDPKGSIHEFPQYHEIAYLEPGKTVRVDALRFPASWDAVCRLEAIEYRSLNWDGLLTRHGRAECFYINGDYEMIPWSDPTSLWRDLLANAYSFLRR